MQCTNRVTEIQRVENKKKMTVIDAPLDKIFRKLSVWFSKKYMNCLDESLDCKMET